MNKKIVIIDDDINHLLTTKSILEEEGYEVCIHQGPFGSTNTIREFEPDIILLDINMPGLSGEKLSQLLKENTSIKDIPIFFYSSNDEDSLRKAVRELKVNGYICKGDLFKLKTKIADYFQK